MDVAFLAVEGELVALPGVVRLGAGVGVRVGDVRLDKAVGATLPPPRLVIGLLLPVPARSETMGLLGLE